MNATYSFEEGKKILHRNNIIRLIKKHVQNLGSRRNYHDYTLNAWENKQIQDSLKLLNHWKHDPKIQDNQYYELVGKITSKMKKWYVYHFGKGGILKMNQDLETILR